jgi:hypothetical protein
MEEGDLGYSEDAFCRVDEDPVPLKSVAGSPYMLLVLLKRPGEKEDVVQVGETEAEFPQNVVHKTLERSGGVV